MKNETQIKSQEIFNRELKKRFPQNDITILEYTKASGPIRYKCNTCGKEFFKTRANHLYENKTLCSTCFSGKRSQLREAFWERNGRDYEILSEVRGFSIAQKIQIRCLKCGREYDYKIQQTIKDGFSCRFCGKNGFPITQEEFERRLKEKTPDLTVIEYKNMGTPVLLSCACCGHIFSKLPNNVLHRPSCPNCRPHRSLGEQKVYEWLVNNGFEFEEQKHFSELQRLSYDFFLPQYNLLIEIQGEQHYTPISFFGGEEKFLRQQLNDQRKREYARNNGLTLLEIPYSSLEDIEDLLEGSTTKVRQVSEKRSPSNEG